jgi:ligand-binding sensor domain-containing protein
MWKPDFSHSPQRHAFLCNRGCDPPRAGDIILALIVILSAVRAFALNPERELSQYDCQTWDRHSGLEANGISSVIQGKDGYIWLGTTAGLVRFDGVEFKLIDLSGIPQLRSSIVTSIAPARDDGLWIGLQNSAYGFFDGKVFTQSGKEPWGGRT